MNNLPATQAQPTGYQHNVPTLAELQQDMEVALKNDKLNYICNQPVPKEWVKKHPTIKVKNDSGAWQPLEYLPVDKVEYLLMRIFGRWRREIKSVSVTANSVMAIVRLYVWNPVFGEWDWHDGVGAVPIQQDSGAEATDINAVKKNAIQIGGGAAVSFALKDAAHCFGSIFGKGLNKSVPQFMGNYSDIKVEQKPSENGNPSQNFQEEITITTPF